MVTAANSGSGGPKAKIPVKQQLARRKQPATPSVEAKIQGKKEAEPTPRPSKPTPLSATHKSNPASITNRRTTQTLKKAVSFSDHLNRGPDRGYTPPADEKAARFAPALVRGEGSEYSDLSPSEPTASPFDRRAANTIGQSEDPSQKPPHCASKPTAGKSASTKQPQSINMAAKDRSERQNSQVDFDIASDSDDSFTDLVHPATLTDDNPPQRGHADLKHHRHSSRMSSPMENSNKVSNLMPGKLSSSYYGLKSEVGDDESYIAAATTENTRRNSLSEVSANHSTVNSRAWKDTKTAPVSHHCGRRLLNKSIGSAMFDHTMRRTRPQPVFVWRGKTSSSVPGRQNQVFALGNDSNPGQPPTVSLTKQQAKRQYQPPSVVDDELDDAIYVNPKNKKTCRDV
ncbi:MAG: hypothetical protein Q9216_000900 [Gyalolechia sp. 2 TL-2023]